MGFARRRARRQTALVVGGAAYAAGRLPLSAAREREKGEGGGGGGGGGAGR